MQLTSPSFDEKEIDAVRKCLASGWVTQGPITAKFEDLIASKHDTKFALATTSCTAALHLATLALGLKAGDEVIVPAFTWVTSAHSAEYVGAKAVFVDVDPMTFNISPEAVKQAITPRTKAIIAVHLFGLSADMDPLTQIAEKHNLAIIEDAACAIGTTYKGKPVGAIGDIGCFSFHPRKVITTGEGGMVTTNHPHIAESVQSLRNHGATGTQTDLSQQGPWTMSSFNVLGFNLRMNDIQSAIGVAQFQKLDGLLIERRQAAQNYYELLKDLGALQVPNPSAEVNLGHTFQSFVIKVKEGGEKKRNDIMAQLAMKEIQTRPGTHAVHKLEYYKNKYDLKSEQFPIASECEVTTITLPIFPGISLKEQEVVVNIIKERF